jgi:hypothetical protein
MNESRLVKGSKGTFEFTNADLRFTRVFWGRSWAEVRRSQVVSEECARNDEGGRGESRSVKVELFKRRTKGAG